MAQFNQKKISLDKTDLLDDTNWPDRSNGVNVFYRLVLPLRKTIRKLWVGAEISLVCIDLLLTIIELGLGGTAAYSIAHVVFSGLALLLSVLDVVELVWFCNCSGWCSDNCKSTKRKYDSARSILTELILTPLLLCSIFEVVIGRGFRAEAEPSETLGMVLFGIDIFATLFLVYIARLGIFIAAVYNTNGLLANGSGSSRLGAITKGKTFGEHIFLFCFILHSAGQTLVHISMLVTIGFILRLENQHLYETQTDLETESYRISGYLIYMCIAVCFLPFLGHFTFLIIANTFANGFSFSVIANFAKLLERPDFFKIPKKVQLTTERIGKCKEALSTVKERYDTFTSESSCCMKIFYPFGNPLYLFFCLVFGLLHLLFYAFALASYTNHKEEAIASETDTYGYALLASFLVNGVVNGYMLLLSSVWAILLLLILLFIICLLVLILVFRNCCKTKLVS